MYIFSIFTILLLVSALSDAATIVDISSQLKGSTQSIEKMKRSIPSLRHSRRSSSLLPDFLLSSLASSSQSASTIYPQTVSNSANVYYPQSYSYPANTGYYPSVNPVNTAYPPVIQAVSPPAPQNMYPPTYVLPSFQRHPGEEDEEEEDEEEPDEEDFDADDYVTRR